MNSNYLFQVSKKYNSKRRKIYSKFRIKTPEQRHAILIVNFAGFSLFYSVSSNFK